RAHDLKRSAVPALAFIARTLEQRVGRLTVRVEKGLAFRGDRITLAAGRGLYRGVAHVIQPRERWIDDAGAGGIAAAKAFLDRLDQFIAVRRCLGDQGEDEQAQFAIVEQTRAASTATALLAAMPAAVS